MKPINAILLLAMVLGGTAAAAADETRWSSKQVKPRITSQDLLKQQAATLPGGEARAVGMKELRPTARRVREGAESLIARSTIISSGKNWTFVPKEAVLHVPAHFKARLNGERTGRLLPWKAFLALNRNWIGVESVSLEQAGGKDPLSEETRQQHRTLSRVVVAVCQGGPISVKPPVTVAMAEPAPESPGQ